MERNATALRILIGVLFLSVGCELAKFDRMPGTSEKTVPKELRGTYQAINGKDTTRFDVTEHSIISKEGDSLHVESIGQGWFLSRVKSTYFMCSQTGDSSYDVSLLDLNGDELTVYPIFESYSDQKLNPKKYFERDSVRGRYIMSERKLLSYARRLRKADLGNTEESYRLTRIKRPE